MYWDHITKQQHLTKLSLERKHPWSLNRTINAFEAITATHSELPNSLKLWGDYESVII